MSRPVVAPLRRAATRAAVGVLAGVLAAAALTAVTGPADAASGSARAKATNVVTPGDFTGYGFDQCHTPSQSQMDSWLQSSPFWAVGIYIAGDSRACKDQPNLTPTWITTQLTNGWRLLPITLGPQASCQPRFPRYGDDAKIKAKPGADGKYSNARAQGSAEATETVSVAKGLGIAPGSTLWYDLEGFDSSNTRCRESALSFLSAWTTQLHALGYVSGVYSSAGSGIAALDSARVKRPGVYTMPDQIWVARWDGMANTTTSYLRADGWANARVKQFQGGHDETWGGVKINIDRDFLDVGRGSVAVPETHCGGVKIAYGIYDKLKPPSATFTSPASKVKALQCLLQEQGLYAGKVNGTFNQRTLVAANTWQTQHAAKVRPVWSARNWMTLLSAGDQPIVKFGSVGPAVRRVQRTLNASGLMSTPVLATGVFDGQTAAGLKIWQKAVGVDVTGVAGTETWAGLAAGAR